MTPKLRQALISFGFLMLLAVLQITIAPLITIGSVMPAFLLIGSVFICLREGRMTAMLVAFPAGLFVDSYLSAVVGISTLSLTVAIFAAGFFYDEEKVQLQISSPRTVLIVFLSALLYHLIYVFSYFQSLDVNLVQLLTQHVFGASLYSTVISAIPVLLLARRTAKLKV
ncbi:MAG: rod shape-determining protein MreD [Bacteroidota bacterium]